MPLRDSIFRFVMAGTLSAVLIGGSATSALADQPYMRRALDQLQSARNFLQSADTDKGGHRIAAMNLIDKAMQEVRAGMRYANGRR
jgi:hypothetical protein